ncbi:MAG: division/cell wall cluster transcriptional repressor MraZ [Tagaea sp.]
MAKTAFISTYTFKIDRKGRVSVPADFRAVMTAKGEDGLDVLPLSGVKAVRAIGADLLSKIGQSADPLAAFKPSSLDHAAILAADLVALQIDSEGRVGLPEAVIAHCGLAETATFAGRIQFFEIWNPEAFAADQAEKRRAILGGGPG